MDNEGNKLSFPAGKVVTVRWPAGTDMSTVHIDYTDSSTTNIEIDTNVPAIEFSAAPGPAFIVLAGESDTFKEVSVFAGGDYVRNTGLSFHRPVADFASPAGYTLATGGSMSVFSSGMAVSWGNFGEAPFELRDLRPDVSPPY